MTSLSTIIQLYRGGQFHWWNKPPTNHWQTLSHHVVWSTSHWQTLSHHVVWSTNHWQTLSHHVVWSTSHWQTLSHHVVWSTSHWQTLSHHVVWSTSHWQTLSHHVVWSTYRHERNSVGRIWINRSVIGTNIIKCKKISISLLAFDDHLYWTFKNKPRWNCKQIISYICPRIYIVGSFYINPWCALQYNDYIFCYFWKFVNITELSKKGFTPVSSIFQLIYVEARGMFLFYFFYFVVVWFVCILFCFCFCFCFFFVFCSAIRY